MEKIISIDGRDILFKTNGAAPLRYKMQFKRDLFADIGKLDGISEKTIADLDLEVFYNIAWVFAKAADATIPPPLEWLETFDEFPVASIFPEIADLLLACISSNKAKN